MLSKEDKGAQRKEQGRHHFIAGAAPLLSPRRGKARVNSQYGDLLSRRARTVERPADGPVVAGECAVGERGSSTWRRRLQVYPRCA
jgi:hypothetical protein